MFELSTRLKQGIAAVARDCASDLEAGFDEEDAGCTFEEALAETAIDAGRLTMWGFPDAQEEVLDLIHKFGYEKVLAEVQKHIYG